MIALHEKYRALKNRFEIVAVHNSDLSSLAEVDRRSAAIRRQFWGDKPLPFPLLLDDEELTYTEFGVSMYPTIMLVDPAGKVVERGDIDRLEAELKKMAGPERPRGAGSEQSRRASPEQSREPPPTGK